MKINNKAVLIAIYYISVYMGYVAYVSYIGLYYSFLGLSPASIGIISAAGSLMTIVSQPLWGSISDRAQSKNRILRLVLLASAVTVWLLPLSGDSLWLIIASSVGFCFFYSSVVPLGDSIVLELAKKNGFSYSIVRTFGSAAFAVMAAVYGKLFSININYLFVMFSSLWVVAFFISFLVPHVKGHNTKENPVGFMELFKDRKLVYLYIYVFLLSTSAGFFMAFHAVYSNSLGISTQLIGLGVMVGSASQLPFMVLFDRIYRKLGIVNIVLASGAIHIARWFLLATVLSEKTILFIWVLHGFNYIVLYFCLAEYVISSVSKELRTRGQVTNGLVIFGLSAIAGSSIGGGISSAFGMSNAFMFFSGLCAFAVVGFFLVSRYSKVFKNEKQAAVQ